MEPATTPGAALLTQQKQHHIVTTNKSVTDISDPHKQFHRDVIRRERQYILLVTDNFYTYTYLV